MVNKLMKLSAVLRLLSEFLIVAISSLLEFYLLTERNFSTSYLGFTPPTPQYLEAVFNIQSGALQSDVNAITTIFYFIMGGGLLYMTLGYIFPFVLSSLSMYYGIKIVVTKYFGKTFYVHPVAFITALNYPLTYYFFTAINNYYYATLPLVIALLDKYLDFETLTWNQALKRGIILSLVVSLGLADPRGTFYDFIWFFVFSVSYIIAKHSLMYLKNWVKVILLGIPFFVLVNFRIFLYYYFITRLNGVEILNSATDSQTSIATERFSVLGVLTGSVNWPSCYTPTLELAGGIFVSLSLLLLLIKRTRRLGITLAFALFTTVFFSSLPQGGEVINWLINHGYYSLVVFVYSNYLPQYFSDEILFLGAGVSIVYAILKAKKLKSRVVVMLSLLVLLTLSNLAFSYNYLTIVSKAYGPPPQFPSYVQDAINVMSNDTSLIFIITPGSLGYQYYLVNLYGVGFGPQWYSYLSAFPIWEISHGVKELGKVFSYLGIEYVMVDTNGMPDPEGLIAYLNSTLKEVFQDHGVYVFYNPDYEEMVEGRDIYVAYDFPCILNYLSDLNNTYVIVPQYFVEGLPQYVKGFIGYNLTTLDLVPFFVNSSDSISFSLSKLHPYGWREIPLFWAGDEVPGYLPGGPLMINVSDGDYVVFVEGGIANLNNYYALNVSSTFMLASGKTTTLITIKEPYSPSTNWFYLGNVTVSNGSLVINWIGGIVPFLVKILLIPINKLQNVEEYMAKSLPRYNIISFDSVNITNVSFSVERINNQLVFIHHGNLSTDYLAYAYFKDYEFLLSFYVQYLEVNWLVKHYIYYYGMGNVYVIKNTENFSSINFKNALPLFEANLVTLLLTFMTYLWADNKLNRRILNRLLRKL